MRDILFRCSSIGKLMAEPVSIASHLITAEVAEILEKKKRSDHEKEVLAKLKMRTLSEGAKTYIRELAQQEIFGIEFEFSSKETQKGIEVEDQSIGVLNRVRSLALVKNTERRSNGYITGECDLFDVYRKRGHDLKSSWSAKTFPGWPIDCEDKLYEWQMRGYMDLWDADEWEVNYVLNDTPERLIGYEPLQLHVVGHIPEHQRLTTWVVKRDREKEDAMRIKIAAARDYYAQVIFEFDHYHPLERLAA